MWCLSQCSITMKRQHDHGNSNKESTSLGPACSFRGLVYCEHGRKHGSTHVDMVLQNSESYIWILRQQEERGTWAWLGFLKL